MAYFTTFPPSMPASSATRSRRGGAPAAGLRCAALLAAIAAGSGCGSGGRDAKGTIEIAVIPKGTSHDFWKCIHAGARKAEAEVNAQGTVRLKVSWKGPLKEDETTDQVNLVDTFVSRGVDGIVLAPLDKAALLRPVQAATRIGIPVVVMDSGLDGTAGKDFVAYVATDNRKGGVLGGQRLGQVLGGKGKVLLLRYQVGSESTMQREEGFLAALKDEFPAIEVVSSDQYAGATEELAFQKSQRLLTRLGGEIDGIFCPNESSTAGMLGALRQAGLAGKVRFVGFDASEKLVTALRRGEIHGLVLQDPVRMACEAVHTLVRNLQKQKVELLTDTGVTVVTPENVEEPRMKELHSPDLSRWLKE
jgi:ribose transport system substrate-binding protein